MAAKKKARRTANKPAMTPMQVLASSRAHLQDQAEKAARERRQPPPASEDATK